MTKDITVAVQETGTTSLVANNLPDIIAIVKQLEDGAITYLEAVNAVLSRVFLKAEDENIKTTYVSQGGIITSITLELTPEQRLSEAEQRIWSRLIQNAVKNAGGRQ